MGCGSCKESQSEDAEHIDDVAQIRVLGGAALKETVGFLEKVDIFKSLAPGDISALARVCAKETFEPKDTIVSRGEPADSLYCISGGIAKAIANHIEVASLTLGEYFGENSILRPEPRHATILAETEVSTLRITRRQLIELNLIEKIELPERKTILGGRDGAVRTQPPSPKTDEDRHLMVKAIHHNRNLAAVAPLSDNIANKLVDAAWAETFSAGEHIITERDLSADYFYIVRTGYVTLTVNVSKDSPTGKCVEKALRYAAGTSLELGPGDSFGEDALLHYSARVATVTAVDQVTLWVVDRLSFNLILSSASVNVAEEYVTYLEMVESFGTLDAHQKRVVAGNLMEMVLGEDNVIFEHGEVATTFYIMLEGKVGLFVDGKQGQVEEASSGKARIFGQRSLIEPKRHDGTLKVLSETAKVLYMHKTAFDVLLVSLATLLNNTTPSFQKTYTDSTRYSSVRTNSERSTIPETVFDVPRSMSVTGFGNEPDPDEPVYFKDLKNLGVLGSGGFGLVELVEHESTGRCFALKAVSKGLIVASGMIKSIKEEKRIQLMVKYPFIIRLYETYNQGQFVYFLMEPALAGELRSVYRKQMFAGKRVHAVFYTASIVLALAHLHGMKIVYRDLKSGNVMLNSSGYAKLTDLGLAKVVASKTYTTIGTPEYTAPEIISKQGYAAAVDWWALGVLVFELMAGYTPFDASDLFAIHLNISRGIAKVQFPEALNGPCKDLVTKLCAHKPAQRIAMKKGGVNNVRDHEWYADMNFDELEQQTVKPPFEPEVKSRRSSLRKRSSKGPEVLNYVASEDVNCGWDNNFATQDQ